MSSVESAVLVMGSNEQECERSRSAKSTSSVAVSSRSIGQTYPSTTTSEPSSLQQQTLFAEVSHAKTSVSRARAQDWRARAAVYGRSSPELLAKYDRASRSWRTFQCSLDGECPVFSETWPRSGMTRNGIAYQLPPLVPLTSETACGLLPTPVTVDSGAFFNRSASAGAKKRPTLGAMAKHGLWPTPTTVSGNNSGRLDEWGGARSRRMTSHLPKNERTGPLNPTFPEWLMGYPIGYTDCGDLETPSSRESRKQSAARS